MRCFVWLTLCLGLVGCHDHLESGAPIQRFDYPDAGVSCWVVAHDYAPTAISCVRVAP